MPTADADYYALLGVAPSADPATIRSAWAVEQRLWGVRQNAPDLATRHAAERHVQLLGLVKDVLLDPPRRANYDRARALLAASRQLNVPVPGTAIPRPASPVRVVPTHDKRVSNSGRKMEHPPAVADQARRSDRGAHGLRAYAARHRDILMPLVIGLAGAVITGTQVFHLDFASILAVVVWLRGLADKLGS